MATFSNESKTAAFTPTNESANSANMYAIVKPGQGWMYDSYLTYDEDPDSISGNARTYNTIGTEPTWTNENKS